MKKMIIKRKCNNDEELKYWIMDTLKYAQSEFCRDKYKVSGYIKDDYYIVTVVEI